MVWKLLQLIQEPIVRHQRCIGRRLAFEEMPVVDQNPDYAKTDRPGWRR